MAPVTSLQDDAVIEARKDENLRNRVVCFGCCHFTRAMHEKCMRKDSTRIYRVGT